MGLSRWHRLRTPGGRRIHRPSTPSLMRQIRAVVSGDRNGHPQGPGRPGWDRIAGLKSTAPDVSTIGARGQRARSGDASRGRGIRTAFIGHAADSAADHRYGSRRRSGSAKGELAAHLDEFGASAKNEYARSLRGCRVLDDTRIDGSPLAQGRGRKHKARIDVGFRLRERMLHVTASRHDPRQHEPPDSPETATSGPALMLTTSIFTACSFPVPCENGATVARCSPLIVPGIRNQAVVSEGRGESRSLGPSCLVALRARV